MRALLLPLPFLVAACGDGGAPVAPDAGAPLLEPPPPGAGRQLAMDVSIASGEETERCQYVVVDEALEIARFEHVYTTGSHHLLLYQTGLTADEAPTEPFACAGAPLTELGVTGIAYAAQVAEGELAYPEGVALKVPAGSVLLVQTHYLNASPSALDAEVRLNLWFTEEPAVMEAGTMFFYDWAILVPAGEEASARMRCQVPADVELLFGMSHMHRRGVGYEAVVDDGVTRDVLFATDQWEGVEPRRYAPSRRVTAGSVIDFRCDYAGDPERTIIEGPSADGNEMCMFIASYYPRLPAPVELCAMSGSGPVFEGTKTCAETVACVQGTDDAIAQEACVLDTCAASGVAASDLMQCMFFACPDECITGDQGCDQCVVDNCLDQFGACQAAAC